MKNIFLGNSYTKGGGETIPRPFSNKSKLSISLDQLSKVLYSLFFLYAKMRAIKIPPIIIDIINNNVNRSTILSNLEMMFHYRFEDTPS